MSWTATIVFLITTNVYGTELKLIHHAKNSSFDNLTPSTNNETMDKHNTCTTKTCENESILIKRWLKESVDPCDNFYDFACGDVEFIAELRSRAYFLASSGTENQLTRLLSQPLRSTDTKAVRLTKIFYQSCVSRSMWNRSETDSMIDRYGGWPSRDGSRWKSKSFDWIEVKKKMQIDGFYLESIFELGFYYDFYDDRKTVLYVIKLFNYTSRKQIDQGMFPLSDVPSKHVNDDIIRYVTERARPARVAITELLDCLDFEKELKKIASTDDKTTRFGSFIRSSVRQIRIDYPYVNWLHFFNGCLNGIQTVTENDTVLVLDPDYFRRLGSVLQRTASERIANYIAFSTIAYGAARLHVEDWSANVTKGNCLLSTKENFPDLIGAAYVQNFVSEETKSAAIKLSEKIRLEFIKMLKNAPWMDNKTISEAVYKANTTKFNIAYCDAHNDNHKLDERYLDFDMQPNASYLQNLLQINKFVADGLIATLRQPLNKDDYEVIQPISTSAYHWSDDNSIDIPAALLQGRFFSIDRPTSLNFGAIGSLIGHEIAHGFDPNGIQYDGSGNSQNLFRDEGEKSFNEKAQCYEKQYFTYKHPSIANLTVNGTKTLNENIADNVGIKAAYAAYQTFIKETGKNLKLPNLNFTPNQLFWIAAAQLYCGRTFVLGYRITTDYEEVHAPNRYRVIGMFRNSDEFARDFQCKIGSYMNPPKDTKCELW